MLTKNIYNKNNKQEKKILVFSNEKKSKWMKMHGMERLTRAKSECSMSKTQKFSKRNAKKLFIKRKKEKRFASLQTVVEGGVHGSSWWKSKKKKVCDVTRKGEVRMNGERTQPANKASGQRKRVLVESRSARWDAGGMKTH